MLAGVLGQCESLAHLNLCGNSMGGELAGRLAEVQVQCWSLSIWILASTRSHTEGMRVPRAPLTGVTGSVPRRYNPEEEDDNEGEFLGR